MQLRLISSGPASRRFATGLALGAICVVAGCATPPPPPPAPTARVYSFDMAGAAKSCTVPKTLALSPGKTAEATMIVGNDGGWCALSVGRAGKPYDAGLVTETPAHGNVYIHTVGDDTRIDYIPAARYAGPDTFTVQLVPGTPVIHATVTVNPG